VPAIFTCTRDMTACR